MEDLHEVGGTPAVMKLLLDEGHARRRLHDGHRARRSPRTWPTCQASKPARRSSIPFHEPIKPTGHIRSCDGNLAPDGAVAKITGKEGLSFQRHGQGLRLRGRHAGGARTQRRSKKGDVVVIRYEGPKGGPGMPEMLTVTSAIMGAGLGKDVALHHRRPVFRRHARLRRRPCHPRSSGRRPDRARQDRRPHHHRRRAERIDRRTSAMKRSAAASRVDRPNVQGDPRHACTSTSRT